MKAATPPERLTTIAAAVVLIAAAVYLWSNWCEFPMQTWNEIRLAPTFGFRHAINPYPGLGEGPLSTWIYGPIPMLLNLPATLAPSANAALMVASTINLATVVLPLAVVFFTASELKPQAASVRWLALGLGVLLLPKAAFLFQVADHAASALGVLSCWTLARDPRVGGSRLALAAALTALAMWSKQTAVFLLPAQLAYLVLSGQPGAAIRYGAWAAAIAAVLLLAFALRFGLANLRLNLVEIPARLPFGGFANRVALRKWILLGTVLLPCVALAGLWLRRQWPTGEQESGRFFQLAVLAFAAMLPIGVVGFAKIGGDTNHFHSWSYLLSALVLAWLGHGGSRFRSAAPLCAAVVIALSLNVANFRSLPGRPFDGHLSVGASLAAQFPGQIWFPQNPLITFYADGTLWHAEDGILTRYLAGLPVDAADLRDHLPPALHAIALPAHAPSPFVPELLPGFGQRTRLPYWVLLSRPASDDADPECK